MTIGGANSYLSDETLTYMHDGVLLSHEFMGVIDRVGDQVNKLKVGQRVVVAFNIACGICEYCQREEYSLCNTTRSSKLHEQRNVTHLEYSYLKNEVLGEQPEYIRVPFADINCLPIPDDVSDEKALFFIRYYSNSISWMLRWKC
jgi:threonine dehydrogenase-like Zn-dependent dehydrogenase